MRIYRIGDRIPSVPMPLIPAGRGFSKLEIPDYMRNPVNARDIAARKIGEFAYGLRYRHINDPNHTLVNAAQSDFNFRSGSLWGQEDVELNIAYSLERNHAIIREVEGSKRSDLIALEIKCKRPYLGLEKLNDYKGEYVHSDGRFPILDDNPKLGEEFIWGGYLEENNLWSYFSPQFDDSLFGVQSLQIHPLGHLVLTYKDLESLDDNILICSAVAMGIILKIPTIYYKFGGDPIYGTVEKSKIPKNELIKVRSILEDMDSERFVFKLNISSIDIEKLNVNSETKSVLLQSLR